MCDYFLRPALIRFGKLLTVAAFTVIAPKVGAADLEPRAYSNIPVGQNFIVAGYAFMNGGVGFSPAVPIKDAQLEVHNSIFAYARSLDIWGKSGKFDIIVPYAWLSGEALVAGEPRSRAVGGFSDPVVRLYVNLLGAPALSVKEFANYKQETILGVSLAVSAPGGQYDDQRLVNIGTNRWYFKPEIGLSKALGPVTLELAASAYIFTDNNQPFQGRNLERDPLYAARGHLIYSFGSSGIWGSLDATFFTGARTTMDGRRNDDMQQTSRLGASLGFPINRQNSIKLYGSSVVSAQSGANLNIIGIAYQHRWGSGL
jgi:hypothetical protein